MENYLGNYIDAITTVKQFKNDNPKAKRNNDNL